MSNPEYPTTIMLYMSKDKPHTLTLPDEICCEECYFPPRQYCTAYMKPRYEPKEATIKVNVDTGDLLERVAEITSLVERCNEMTKDAKKALSQKARTSVASQMKPSVIAFPRSIP